MVTNTKRHTEISVTDDSTNITVFGPDPQVRENYDETIKYIRDLELKMRGYAPNEDTGPKPIASYRTVGKTNEDTDRTTLKDLSGNGHDIVLKNFGFTLGSGYGSYAIDFRSFSTKPSSSSISASTVYYTVPVNSVVSVATIVGFFFEKGETLSMEVPSFVVDIESEIVEDVYYNYITEDGVYKRIQMVNGRNVIPKSFATLVTTKGLVGFTCRRVDDTTRGKSVLIKQIPEYEGALVFDGVDDYGICENFPALNDFTFVYKRINLNPSKSTNCFLSKSASTNQAQQFCSELAYSQNTYVRLGNKDIAIKDVYNPELSIVYVTKESYNGEMNLASSNYTSTVDDLYIGTFSRGIQAYVWKGALYAIDIYDRTLNSDELQIALQNIEK